MCGTLCVPLRRVTFSNFLFFQARPVGKPVEASEARKTRPHTRVTYYSGKLNGPRFGVLVAVVTSRDTAGDMRYLAVELVSRHTVVLSRRRCTLGVCSYADHRRYCSSLRLLDS
jgi:hypothetical protein